jgi:hypothetical protein
VNQLALGQELGCRSQKEMNYKQDYTSVSLVSILRVDFAQSAGALYLLRQD